MLLSFIIPYFIANYFVRGTVDIIIGMVFCFICVGVVLIVTELNEKNDEFNALLREYHENGGSVPQIKNISSKEYFYGTLIALASMTMYSAFGSLISMVIGYVFHIDNWLNL